MLKLLLVDIRYDMQRRKWNSPLFNTHTVGLRTCVSVFVVEKVKDKVLENVVSSH